ncbi:hypothetical protein B7486_44575 [cyanobacterium TDX16]|nr:hypothetical protein B7486_44575 [cyanobacterium TDX16]
MVATSNSSEFSKCNDKIQGTIRQQNSKALADAIVQIFDKDLRTQQLLGKAITNVDGYYQIFYTAAQFRRAEKGSADLTFQVTTSDGTKCVILDVVVDEQSLPEPKIIFNAPTEVCADLVVVPQPKTQLSEYERYIAILTPVLEDVSLASLTDEDVTFLVGDTGIEQQHIEFLRQSARLAQETNIPTEAFYGFARQNLPLNLQELLARSTEDLRQALETAIEQNIIPASLRESLEQILTRLEQLKVETGILIAHRFIGKLLNRDTSVPLTDLTVKGFDLDAGSEPKALGYDITNTQGIFVLTYTTPRETASKTPATDDAGRRIRLQITLNPATNQTYETEVRAKSDDEILEIRVPIPAPEVPPEHELPNLANNLQLELPAELLSFLNDRRIRTLEDIRKAGGISQLEGLPLEANDPAIRILEAHADLIRVSPEVTLNEFLIEKNYDSVAAIANATQPDFVRTVFEIDSERPANQRIGDFKAAQIHVMARAQSQFLHNLVLPGIAAEHANRFQLTSLELDESNSFFPERCGCRDCETAVSPLVYLADLLKYATQHLKNNGNPVTASDLANIFHQPFDSLTASCEAVDIKVRQIRLCIEVLRHYLGIRPLADAQKEAKLSQAEKDYRLAAYTALLTRIGTSLVDLRLSQTAEPEFRQTLAEQLGINRSHLLDLYLNPNANPEVLTEQRLEQLFGLADTTRDPLSESAKLGDPQGQIKRWNLDGVKSSQNTDQNGMVFVSLTNPSGSGFRVELYQDRQRTKIIADGESATSAAIVKLIQRNKSGLSGILDIAYTADDANIEISAIPNFLSWRLQHLRTLWKEQDWPSDQYEETQSFADLKQLPQSIQFPPALLANKIRYDADRQQLVFNGVMSDIERNTLLTLAPQDSLYQKAINILFQNSQRLPIIDPDLIGPDDFRNPTTKTNQSDPDKAFDIWKNRREWVDAGLRTLSNLTKQVPITINGQPQQLQVPDITAMFGRMYQPVIYGANSIVPWGNTTQPSDFETLYDKLVQGTEVEETKLRIRADLNLSVESFTRLMAIYAKDKAWQSNSRNEKVTDEEWREVYSILLQAQKVKFFAIWRDDEQQNGIRFGLEEFWLSLRQPQEGDWPPVISPQNPPPLIDPDILKLTDLPEPTAGEKAIALWQARRKRLDEDIPKELDNKRKTQNFDAMLQWAIGYPNSGDRLQHDLTVLKNDLNSLDANIVKEASRKIEDDLHLTVEGFKRLMLIKEKNDASVSDPEKEPTAAEWDELYAILTPARKIKHEYTSWRGEEQQNPPLVYYTALKAKLSRWRASLEARQQWQQALRTRSHTPVIDPDLIRESDLQNPVQGNLVFNVWKKRQGEINTELVQLEAAPKNLVGFDTLLERIINVTKDQFLAIAEAREKGNLIGDRLTQLTLEVGEFNYLLRIRQLLDRGQPVLDSEWENVYAILVQVWKRRNFARWQEEEKVEKILLSPDFFQILPPEPIQFPPQELPLPKEPTAIDLWRAPREARQEWLDKLQSRLDQERAAIQSLKEAVSAAEEATIPMLRDALILATNSNGVDLDEKAKWVTENLLIEGRASGCLITTRVDQAIETLQVLIWSLRLGHLEDNYRTLTLDNRYFDEEWKWMGSYATWRAAIIVFLYSENILLPSLRKWEPDIPFASRQTPAFDALVKNTQSNRRLTSSNACSEAKRYAKYYQDICSLQLEASCQSRTKLFKGERCSRSESTPHCLFYMFGRGGLTKTVYWSAYDPLVPPGYDQTFWQAVDVNGFDNIIEIIGAVPYQIAPEKRFIFLFARKQEGAVQKLVYAKFDLENYRWEEKARELTPPDNATSFSAVTKQVNYEDEPPHLVIQVDNGKTYERKLNRFGEDWEDAEFGLLSVLQSDKIVGMVEHTRNSFYLFASYFSGGGSSNFVLSCSLYSPNEFHIPNANPKSPRYLFYGLDRFEGTVYKGAFCWPGTNIVYLVTGEISFTSATHVSVIREAAGTLTNMDIRPVNAQISQQLGRIVPRSGVVDQTELPFKVRFACNNAGEGSYHFRFFKFGDGLAQNNTTLAAPSVSGPFEIVPSSSTESLQMHKGLIEKAFTSKDNAIGPASNLTYLEEAYYFVPIHLALALQRNGEYTAALDWFRIVYDYTFLHESKRKIYYGLVKEEVLLDIYKRKPDWLLDPLNPHAIAAERRNTYTRFTLLSIIRCLLDYADAEFTTDTAESNARARQLYLNALDLLDTKELKQRRGECEDLIGILDEEITETPWRANVTLLKQDLRKIPNAPILEWH